MAKRRKLIHLPQKPFQPKSAHLSLREGPNGSFDLFAFYVDELGRKVKPDPKSVAHCAAVLLVRHCDTLGQRLKDLATSTDPNDFLSSPPTEPQDGEHPITITDVGHA